MTMYTHRDKPPPFEAVWLDDELGEGGCWEPTGRMHRLATDREFLDGPGEEIPVDTPAIADPSHEGKALRHNEGKPMLSLITPEFELEMAKVMTEGAKKYAVDNWRNSLGTVDHDNFRRKSLDSMLRHVNKMRMGEMYDDESGCLHLAHVAVNAMFIATYDEYTGSGE